ncbi:hypothetical protein PR003_g23804 [Phytophthora rubi]|uniref:Uncharacterized protein n=1 Tax=Phytophthora rubi TaxID=129364 RepID=A0A6A3ITF5_9STRA|nr:hypothetical protein PR001_g22628 [Phytophthora rubi]KAE9296243.1 hypothetical protein PR003_g23804 [Phytophthora rubi]
MVKEFVRLSELGIFQFESPATKTSPVPTMNLRGFFTAAAAIIAVSIATAQAETIDHDQVVPFAQPEASTISQKAAVKFKPQIHITNGCHPYPAVNEAGQTGGGLKPTGAPSSSCKGSGWGSQVYGRSTCPTILAASPSAHSGYSYYVPPSSDSVDGNSVKVNYESHWPINHALDTTSESGEFQDLIMWDQLTDVARLALNTTSFGKANVPMNDGNFLTKLGNAWPF